MADADLKMDGLIQIIKALKMNPPIARVGILGDKTARSDGSLNNATIGAAHEFGTSSIPQRSFLRMPITDHLQKGLEDSGAFTEDSMKQIMKQGSLNPWIEKMAIEAVGIVNDAFDTGGFGQWVALAPSTLNEKKVKQILVETQQLRNSITYEVKDA